MKALILEEVGDPTKIEIVYDILKKLEIDNIRQSNTVLPEALLEVVSTPEIIIFPWVSNLDYFDNVLFSVINFFLVVHKKLPRLIVVGPHDYSALSECHTSQDTFMSVALKTFGSEREDYYNNFRAYKNGLEKILKDYINEKV